MVVYGLHSMKIAHIIGVIELQERHESSYLHIAQPVTIKSMVMAKNKSNIEVDLVAVKHREETVDVPSDFIWAKDLERWSYDVITELPKTKKLPLIADILQSLYDISDADYFIYTNVDIGLSPNFYDFVAEKLNEGFDALCINRRDMPKKVDGELIAEHNFQKLLDLEGTFHPGKDCFVFKRSSFNRMEFGNTFIGTAPIGQVMLKQIQKTANNFHWVNRTKKSSTLNTFHIGSDRAWNNPKCQYWLENVRQAELIGTKGCTAPK